MSGALNHILVQAQVSEIFETIEIDELRIPSSNYTLIFPDQEPVAAGLSLVVSSIDQNVVTTTWSAPTTESAGLSAANADLLLDAPATLSTSYSLQFPDSASSSLVGRVLSISAASANHFELEFKDFSSVLDVRITDPDSSNFLKFEAFPNLSSDYAIYLNSDFTAGVDSMLEKIPYVVADDGAGTVTLGLADPFSLYPISFVSLSFEMNPSQTNDASIIFPSFRTLEPPANKLLGCVSQSSVDVQLGYLSSPQTTGLGFGKLLLDYNGNALDLVLPEPFQRNVQTHNAVAIQKHYETAVVQIGSLDEHNHAVASLERSGKIFDADFPATLMAGASAGSGNTTCTLPLYDKTRSKVGDYLVATADDMSGNIELGFDSCPKIIDSVHFATNPPPYTRLATKDNVMSFKLFLPEFSSALQVNELRAQALRISENSSQEARLSYLDGGFVFSTTYERSVRLLMPGDYAANNSSPYTLTLPALDSALGSSNGYAGQILSVVSSSPTSIELALVTLSQFSQIKSLGLSADSGATVTTLLPGDGAATNLLLRLPSSGDFGDVLGISLVTVGATTTIADLEFVPPLTLLSNTGVAASLRAKQTQSDSYDLVLPSLYAGRVERSLLVSSSGALELEVPRRIEFRQASANSLDSQYIRLALPASLASSYSLEFPDLSSADETGKILAVASTSSAATVPLEFIAAGLVRGASSSVLVRAPSGLASSVRARLPSKGAETAGQVLSSSFSDGVHTLSFVDLLALPISDQASSAHTCSLRTRAKSSELDYDMLLRAPVDAAFPQRRAVVQPGASVISVRLLSTSNVAGTYTATGAGVGDTLSGTGALTVDSLVVSVVGQHVLLNGQTSSLENGIYTLTAASPFVLTRHALFDRHDRIVPGVLAAVTDGTHAGETLICDIVPFRRVGRGIVRSRDQNIESEQDCRFITDGAPVANQLLLVQGATLRVTAVLSETAVGVFPTPPQIEDARYLLGFRTGVDPVSFRAHDDAVGSRTRVDIEFGDAVFDRIEVGSSLILQARQEASQQQILLPDFVEIGKCVSASVSGSVVTLGAEAPAEMMSVAGSVTLVSLPGSGVNTIGKILSDTSGMAFAIAFDGLSATSTAPAPFSLVSAAYGTLGSTSEYVLRCERDGLYALALSIGVVIESVNSPIDHGRGTVALSLKRTDNTFANAATASTDQEIEFEDSRVLSGGVGASTELVHVFIVETTATTELRLEIRHTHANPADVNGVFSVGKASLLIQSVE